MVAWQRAIFLAVPLPPLKRCHHRIAGNRCPGTSSWLCPSKQAAISSKSSEVSPLVFDEDSSPPTALIASGMPRLQAGMVPALAGTQRLAWSKRKVKRRMERRIFRRHFSSYDQPLLQSYTLQFRNIIRFSPQHPSMLPFIHLHLSHAVSAGIFLTSTLCCPLSVSSFLCPLRCSFRPIVPVPRWHHGSSMEVCFSSSSILILLAPSPVPMPAPAQVLTGWHCANLPPPSLSFVAHPSVALPPVSTFPSLSLPLISFIHFLNHLASLCA